MNVSIAIFLASYTLLRTYHCFNICIESVMINYLGCPSVTVSINSNIHAKLQLLVELATLLLCDFQTFQLSVCWEYAA